MSLSPNRCCNVRELIPNRNEREKVPTNDLICWLNARTEIPQQSWGNNQAISPSAQQSGVRWDYLPVEDCVDERMEHVRVVLKAKPHFAVRPNLAL